MSGGTVRVEVSGPVPYVVEIEDARERQPPAPDHSTALVPLEPTRDDTRVGRRRFEVVVDGWRFEATVEDAALAALRRRAERGAGEDGPVRAVTVRAQIPGRVARVFVATGDSVEAGARLLSVEAMKMENEIRAPRAGTVRELSVVPGATVELGQDLVTIG